MKHFLTKGNPGLRDLQAFHEALDRDKGFDVDMLRNIAYLSEEVGEVVTAIRALQEAENPAELDAARADLGEELADCLAYILKLANYGGVALEEAYVKKMQRNIDRTWSKARRGG